MIMNEAGEFFFSSPVCSLSPLISQGLNFVLTSQLAERREGDILKLSLIDITEDFGVLIGIQFRQCKPKTVRRNPHLAHYPTLSGSRHELS